MFLLQTLSSLPAGQRSRCWRSSCPPSLDKGTSFLWNESAQKTQMVLASLESLHRFRSEVLDLASSKDQRVTKKGMSDTPDWKCRFCCLVFCFLFIPCLEAFLWHSACLILSGTEGQITSFLESPPLVVFAFTSSYFCCTSRLTCKPNM